MLNIHKFSVKVDSRQIIDDVSISIPEGKVHAIMGPNGSGKTSLVMGIMGHPGYMISDKKSKLILDKKNIIEFAPELRAKEGIFVSFQNPIEIEGVSFLAFVRTAAKALRPDEKISLTDFKKIVIESLEKVGLDSSFMQRSMNSGFSGGEKKRAEIAQMLILKPKFAILDEIDSGLDIDSLKNISNIIRDEVKNNNLGVLIITHYQRLLHYIEPDKIHVLIDGKIKKSGDISLVEKIEKLGYASI